MDRRELLSVLGGGMAGLVAQGGSARADQDGRPHDEHLQTITDCARVCNEASHHCLSELKKGSPHPDYHAKAHAAAMDCQAFCTLTAALSAQKLDGPVRPCRVCQCVPRLCRGLRGTSGRDHEGMQRGVPKLREGLPRDG